MNEQAVLVTGASTGIGRACALHLDSLGFRTFAGVRRESDGDALRAISSSRLAPLLLDVTDADSIKGAARTVADAVQDSRLLGIVNNAGVVVSGPLEFVTPEDLRHQFEVNVIGQLQVTQAFLPLIRESRGRIVFMSSMGGRLAQPLVGAYCASKFALEAMGDSLRIELKPWGIDVALIEPGAVATPIWDKGLKAAEAAVDVAPPQMQELYGVAIDLAKKLARRELEIGVPPERVADAVGHALTAARPKTRYIVGREARLALLAKRLLPDRALDRVILRTTGLPGEEGAPTRRPAEPQREAATSGV